MIIIIFVKHGVFAYFTKKMSDSKKIHKVPQHLTMIIC